MPVTDRDEERTVAIVLADVAATIGASYEWLVRKHAAHIREFATDPEDYLQRVAEDTQQDLHDRHIDTDWPKCPLHAGRHPLWLGDGGWRCETSDVLIAPLGRLGADSTVPF